MQDIQPHFRLCTILTMFRLKYQCRGNSLNSVAAHGPARSYSNKSAAWFWAEVSSFVMTIKHFRMKTGIRDNKEEIWLSPMTKAPTPTEMSKGQSDNITPQKNSITQQLRMAIERASLVEIAIERASLVEYACQIWSLYLLRFKSYSKCWSWQQTNKQRQTDKQTDRTKTICPPSFDPGGGA